VSVRLQYARGRANPERTIAANGRQAKVRSGADEATESGRDGAGCLTWVSEAVEALAGAAAAGLAVDWLDCCRDFGTGVAV
jgi:hypothetical protein